MQPHLDAGDGRPAGPQMFADWAGARSTGPFDPGTTFVNYPGRLPDYVMGTDAKKAMAWPDERASAATPPGEAAEDTSSPPDEPLVLTRAAFDEQPRTHAYPSMDGDHPSVIEATPDVVADSDAPLGDG